LATAAKLALTDEFITESLFSLKALLLPATISWDVEELGLIKACEF
jgi:hypothetical protein